MLSDMNEARSNVIGKVAEFKPDRQRLSKEVEERRKKEIEQRKNKKKQTVDKKKKGKA